MEASRQTATSLDVVTRILVGAVALAMPVTAALGQYLFPVNMGLQLYGYRMLVMLALPLLLFATRGRISLGKPARLFALTFYLWLVWGAASISWTPDVAAGFNEVMTVAFGAAAALVIALCCALVANGTDLLRRGWVVAYVATVIIAVWELSTHQHLPSSFAEAGVEGAGGLVVATFGNPNNYAAFIVLAFPFIIWSLGMARGARWLFYLLLCLSVPVVLVLTAGRLGLVALVLQGATLMVLQRRRGASLKWFLPLAAIVMIIAVMMLQANPRVLSKLLVIGDEVNRGSGSARLNLSLNGLQFTAESFGFGKGAGSFEQLILSGQGKLPTAHISNPHNFWIEVLSQYGLLVFSCLVGSLLYACSVVARLSRSASMRGANHYWPLVALGLGLAGYWLVAVENSRFIPQPINWAFLGSVMALTSQLLAWNGGGLVASTTGDSPLLALRDPRRVAGTSVSSESGQGAPRSP
jgi:teichuronic acid biosynthesis protein TuaE